MNDLIQHGTIDWETIFNAIGHPTVIIDRNHRVIAANNATIKLTGIPNSGIIGRPCYEIFHGKDFTSPAIGCPMEQMLRSGRLETTEMELEALSGIFLVSCTPVLNARGELEKIIHIATDITERKNAENALRASESMFRTTLESIPFDIFMLNRDGRYIMQNSVSRLLWGDVVSKRPDEITDDPVKLTLWQSNNQRALAGEVVKAEECFVINGKMRNILNIIAPVKDGDEVCGIVGMNIDITERKQAEQALRESEDRFRTIFEAAPDAIFLAESETGRIIEVNAAAERLLQRPRSEIIGLHQSQLHPPEIEQEVRRVFADHLAQFKPEGVETVVIRKDGSRVPVHIEAQLITLDEMTILQGVFRDISREKLIEEQRRKVNEQLQQAQRLEAVGILAGGIAHDFNNLLQGVFGYLQMARLLIDDKKKALGMLEQAEQALMMSVNLSTQLLTFAKGGKPVKKKIGLKSVIDNSVKFALSGARADANLDIAADLRLVEVDEGQLAQVIQNIVLNASEAQPDGGTITISAVNVDIPKGMNHALPAGGRYVLITIKDSGMGIPAQYLPRIFEPYFTTKQRGSGIGLATSYSIIKNHGGLIEVTSEVNQGSTFSIYLPAVNTGGQPESVVSGQVKAHKGRILLMDDDELVRTVVVEMLTALGHEVEYAAEGKEAVEKFLLAGEAGRPFDILIFDLTVRGGMGGEEAIKKIREIDPNVVAVVSSGYADSPVLADFRAYGFSASLHKPYTIESVNTCLHMLMGKQASPSAS